MRQQRPAPHLPAPHFPALHLPALHLIVQPLAARGEPAFAVWAGRPMACAIGRGGLTESKHEGDGKTPTGTFAMRAILWRPDRVRRPISRLPAAALSPRAGWCTAPGNPAYNAPVLLPYPAPSEALWRHDHMYDLILILGYNDAPVRPGRGSAIFLHIASPGLAPTAGCIALRRPDLEHVLADAVTGSTVIVRSGAPAIPAGGGALAAS